MELDKLFFFHRCYFLYPSQRFALFDLKIKERFLQIVEASFSTPKTDILFFFFKNSIFFHFP